MLLQGVMQLKLLNLGVPEALPIFGAVPHTLPDLPYPRDEWHKTVHSAGDVHRRTAEEVHRVAGGVVYKQKRDRAEGSL